MRRIETDQPRIDGRSGTETRQSRVLEGDAVIGFERVDKLPGGVERRIVGSRKDGVLPVLACSIVGADEGCISVAAVEGTQNTQIFFVNLVFPSPKGVDTMSAYYTSNGKLQKFVGSVHTLESISAKSGEQDELIAEYILDETYPQEASFFIKQKVAGQKRYVTIGRGEVGVGAVWIEKGRFLKIRGFRTDGDQVGFVMQNLVHPSDRNPNFTYVKSKALPMYEYARGQIVVPERVDIAGYARDALSEDPKVWHSAIETYCPIRIGGTIVAPYAR